MHFMKVDRDDVCFVPAHCLAHRERRMDEQRMNEWYTLSFLRLSLCLSFVFSHNQIVKCGFERYLINSFSTEVLEPLCQDHKRDFVENHFLKIPAHYYASDRCYYYHMHVERELTVFAIRGNRNSVGSGVGDVVFWGLGAPTNQPPKMLPGARLLCLRSRLALANHRNVFCCCKHPLPFLPQAPSAACLTLLSSLLPHIRLRL